MKRLFSIFTAIAILAGFTACEKQPDTQTPNDQTPTIVLNVDKQEIAADGVDFATFEVLVNGQVLTSECQIINLKDNSILDGTTFSTTEAGSYSFKAAYGSATSDTKTITAVDSDEPIVEYEVELLADKSEIAGDNTDTVTFTVKVNGESINDGYTITNLNYGNELEGSSFTSDVAGDFVFEATYEGVKSNQVTITVTAVEAPVQKQLTLSVDKSRIKADGVDTATFTVKYGDDDVTASATINCVSHSGITVENNAFSSTSVGSYSFRATYNGTTTGQSITIDVYDPAITGAYEVGTYYNEGGVEGIIYAIKADRHGDTYVYIMSLDEEDLQWSTEYTWCNCGSEYGSWNTEDMLRFGTSPDKYPAAQWCVAHGEGWFLPSSKELNWMWEAITNGERDFKAASVAQYNKLLTDHGGEPFCETFYWSSNETSEDLVEVIAFMNDSIVCLDPLKDNVYTARAVYRFLVE